MKIKKSWKIVLWIAGILIALLIISSLAVKLIFTREKLLSLIKPRVEEAINRKVSIEDVSPSIFKGLGVDIKGLTVSNLPGYSSEDLFRISKFSVRVKFLPLLRKRIEVKKIILEKPEIFIEKNREKILNVADLMKGGGGALPLIIFENVEIKDGKFLYTDLSTGSKIQLEGIEQKGKFVMDEKLEIGKSEGRLSIQRLDLNLAGFKGKLPELTLSFQHKLSLNLPGDYLEVEKITIDLAKISLEIKGKIENLKDIPRADLVLSSKDISVQELLASLAGGKDSPLSRLKGSGEMRMTSSLKGELKGKELPAFQGMISLQKVKIDFAEFPQPFVLPQAEINFDNRGASIVTTGAKLGDTPMELKAVVSNYADPDLTSELKSKLNLSIIKEFKKLPEGTNLAGQVEMDVKAFGKLKNVEKLDLTGKFNLRKVELNSPSLTVPVENLNGDLSLSKGILNITDLSMNMGKSSLNLRGKVENILQSVLSKKGEAHKPLLSFSLKSDFIDLDEILPAEQKGTSEKNKDLKTAPPFPDINATGKIDIKKVIFRQVEFENLMADLEVKNRIVKVENVITSVYSGSVGGNATYDMTDVDNPGFNIKVNASQIEANNFLTRFTLFKEHLFGELNLTADFSGRGMSIEEITKSLIASGKGTITEGRLVNWEFLNKISGFLKLNQFKEEKIKNLSNSFLINNSRVYFEDFEAFSESGDWKATGSIGLDGSLNYLVSVVLSPELSGKINLGDLGKLFQDERGRIVLDFEIGGNVDNPKFALSTSRQQKRYQEEIQEQKDKLKEDLKKKGQDLLKKLLDK
ncbi:MAG: AsmA family protein [candidate division Zixibacteria bacterium]|nr:AsmA family protein [candidate division Zixibacteria bacterium]